MKKTWIWCEREFEPVPLPSTPIRLFTGIEDPWEKICPPCALEEIQKLNKLAVNFIQALRSELKGE